jgi:hypothetical protein
MAEMISCVICDTAFLFHLIWVYCDKGGIMSEEQNAKRMSVFDENGKYTGKPLEEYDTPPQPGDMTVEKWMENFEGCESRTGTGAGFNVVIHNNVEYKPKAK